MEGERERKRERGRERKREGERERERERGREKEGKGREKGITVYTCKDAALYDVVYTGVHYAKCSSLIG